MGTSAALLPSVRSAFGGFIDYAGLFPPAQLSLAQASEEYRQARAGSGAWMLGRFIIPLPLLASSPRAAGGPFSAIADGGSDVAQWADAMTSLFDDVVKLRADGVAIEALEIPLPVEFSHERRFEAPLRRVQELLQSTGLSQLSVYVEIPRSGEWARLLGDVMVALAGAGCGAKLRCGGVTAAAVPSVDEVAGFIVAARAARVTFKATAGLHHPFRHLDASAGFTMHGFVNLLAAAALAPSVDFETVRRVVADEDPGAFVFERTRILWRDRPIGVDDVAKARREAFVSYGSCSFSEPREDLAALGVLGAQ